MRFAELPEMESAGLDYQAIEFDFQRSPDQGNATPVQKPVVVVGAGPVGSCMIGAAPSCSTPARTAPTIPR